MTYEELLEKKENLQNELDQVQKDIYAHENFQFLEYLDTAIDVLHKASSLKPCVNIEIEYECGDCGKEDYCCYELSDIVYSLKVLKKNYDEIIKKYNLYD